MDKKRVFINGFGRIGRSAARIILEDDTMELVGINDIYDFSQMAYLLKYDSVYDTLNYDISIQGSNMIIDKHSVELYCVKSPSDLHLHSLGVDVLLECSGLFLTLASTQAFIDNGAKKVLVSTPPQDDMPTYIYGVNDDKYGDEPIISNSSCSTNAIVPILSIVDKYFGVAGALMHMFHSYTAYQNLLDSKHYSSDMRRARAAASNIIPIDSSAARATAYFFPHLEKNLYAKSIRIPVAATTMYDLSIKLKNPSTIDKIKSAIELETNNRFKNIINTSSELKVSSDYIASPYSATIDIPLLDLAGDNLLRVSAWQDNEYGYASRLVDMAKVMSSSSS